MTIAHGGGDRRLIEVVEAHELQAGAERLGEDQLGGGGWEGRRKDARREAER